jgi:glycerol-3-phosphate O-acyltransferase
MSESSDSTPSSASEPISEPAPRDPLLERLGLPAGGDPLSAMAPRFNLLFRAFQRRFFAHFDLDEETAGRLRELEQQGNVIYVMRYSSRLDYFLFNTVLARAGLRLSAFANGIRFHYYRPLLEWLRIALRRKRAQPRALDRNEAREHVRTLARGGASFFLFLRTERFRTWLRGGRNRRHDELDLLEVAVRAVWDSGKPTYVVPLAVFWRKGPRSQSRFLNLDYGALTRPSDLAKVTRFLATYRSLAIKTGEPIDLARFIDERGEEGAARIARKVRRSILIYLYREEKVVQGPTLRSLARVRDDVLTDPGVQAAIAERARNPKSSSERAHVEAEKMFRGIAARMNSTLLAIADAILTQVFKRLFSSVEVSGIERMAELAKRHPIVLLPNHRSYLDFLLLSVVLYRNFMLPPHIGARDNMAFGPFGFLLRRCGAFYMRGSFDDPLYREVFRAYLGHLVREGLTQEFFIEGTRSRTGKSLAPKLGMLGWEVEAFLDSARRDFLFVPVSIGYERLVEESSMVDELEGGEKTRESVLGLVRARKFLNRRFGSVRLNFDEPISLAERLGENRSRYPRAAIDRCEAGEAERLRAEKRVFIESLGRHIVERINAAMVVNATSVAATVLLGVPHRGLLRPELVERMQQIVELLRVEGVRLTPALVADEGSFEESIAFLQRADLVESVEERRGEILFYAESRRRALDIYRNSIAHYLATPSCLARSVLAGASEKELREDVATWHELLYREFFIPSDEALTSRCDRLLGHFEEVGWARRDEDVWAATEAGEPVLRCLAEQSRGVIEAYMACCSALGVLEPGAPGVEGDAEEPVEIDKKGLRKRAEQYFHNAELLGEAARPEAANDTTFANALDLLVERRILVEHRGSGRRSSEARYARGEDWSALSEFRERLAGALASG